MMKVQSLFIIALLLAIMLVATVVAEGGEEGGEEGSESGRSPLPEHHNWKSTFKQMSKGRSSMKNVDNIIIKVMETMRKEQKHLTHLIAVSLRRRNLANHRRHVQLNVVKVNRLARLKAEGDYNQKRQLEQASVNKLRVREKEHRDRSRDYHHTFDVNTAEIKRLNRELKILNEIRRLVGRKNHVKAWRHHVDFTLPTRSARHEWIEFVESNSVFHHGKQRFESHRIKSIGWGHPQELPPWDPNFSRLSRLISCSSRTVVNPFHAPGGCFFPDGGHDAFDHFFFPTLFVGKEKAAIRLPAGVMPLQKTFYSVTPIGNHKFISRMRWAAQGVFQLEIYNTQPHIPFKFGYGGDIGSDADTKFGVVNMRVKNHGYHYNIYTRWNNDYGKDFQLVESNKRHTLVNDPQVTVSVIPFAPTPTTWSAKDSKRQIGTCKRSKGRWTTSRKNKHDFEECVTGDLHRGVTIYVQWGHRTVHDFQMWLKQQFKFEE